MNWLKRFGKIFVFDFLAVLCFIGVILFGWLPGPGGIPLFLLGLSLLAVNHDWAERWLSTAKLKGVSIKKWLFPNIEWIKRAYDIVATTAMITASLLLYKFDSRLIEGFAILVIFFSLFIFLVNRNRFDSFSKLLKKIYRRTTKFLKHKL